MISSCFSFISDSVESDDYSNVHQDSLDSNTNSLDLPSYYFDDDYLTKRIETINMVSKAATISFAFITDMHWTLNKRHSLELLSAINECCDIDFLVNCGDVINGGTATIDNLSYLLDIFSESNRIFGIKNYYVKGNHDNGQEWDVLNGQWTAPTVSDEDIKSFINNDERCVYNPEDEFAYYIDDSENKIRFYFLNTGLSGSSYDVDWFYSTLKEMPDGYYVGVFAHIYFYPSLDSLPSYEEHSHLFEVILDALNNKTFVENNGVIYDFSNKENTVLFFMSGHIHADFAIISDSGYPIIATTCDTFNDLTSDYSCLEPIIREAGTYSEQAFDVVHLDIESRTINLTRIGGGKDRLFYF